MTSDTTRRGLGERGALVPAASESRGLGEPGASPEGRKGARSARRRERRNLARRGRGGIIYYERLFDGERVRFSTGATDWTKAAAVRDCYEAERAERGARATAAPVPTFAEAARAALDAMDARREAGAVEGYSTTTARERPRILAADGPVLPLLGSLRLDGIGAPTLRVWYDREVIGRRRSPKTAANLLDAVEMVFRQARARGEVPFTLRPVAELRAQLREERRTKRARAAQDTRRRLAKDAVLTPDQVGALVAAAREEGREALVVVLLAVECGLRRGEIHALAWGDVAWGQGEDDPTRALEVGRSNSSGRGVEATKSGKVRRPHLSRRTWRELRALYRERWEPGPEARIVTGNYWDLSTVLLRRILRRAGLPARTFQNLRATAGSLLRQWGIPPEYARAALGHEGEAVAEAHYTALDFRVFRPPERVDPGQGETPMDLFERLCPEPAARRESPHLSPHLGVEDEEAEEIQAVTWRPQRESNPCCRLERAES